MTDASPATWLSNPGLIRRCGDFYLAASAVALGDVTIGAGSSVWPFACIRGDVAPIVIGERVSVQDYAMLHCRHGVPLVIGDDVIIGHHATVHCARVGRGVLVGIRSAILDDSQIGDDCIVAAGAVVVPGTVVPPGTVMAGIPAKPLREVSDRDRRYMSAVAARYVALAQAHVDGRFSSLAPLPAAPAEAAGLGDGGGS